MNLSTAVHRFCGIIAAKRNVAVNNWCEPVDTKNMEILPRLISISMRKFSEQPSERQPAVRMLTLNAVRLSCAILGRDQTKALVAKAMGGADQ